MKLLNNDNIKKLIVAILLVHWNFVLRMIFVILKIHNIFVNITKLINCFQIYGLLAFWRSIYNFKKLIPCLNLQKVLNFLKR
jgi:hypothetical protein